MSDSTSSCLVQCFTCSVQSPQRSSKPLRAGAGPCSPGGPGRPARAVWPLHGGGLGWHSWLGELTREALGLRDQEGTTGIAEEDRGHTPAPGKLGRERRVPAPTSPVPRRQPVPLTCAFFVSLWCAQAPTLPWTSPAAAASMTLSQKTKEN